MKRLTLLSYLFVLVLLVIPALELVAGAPVSPDVQPGNQGSDSPIESIIKKAQEYRKVGNFEEALKLLDTALEKFPQKEDREKLQVEVADLHYVWVEYFEKKYDYANAIKHLEMAYYIHKNYRLKEAAIDLNDIGFFYSALGQNQKALEYFEKALPIRKELGDRAGEAQTLNNIGRIYDVLGQKQKALEYFEKALLIRKALGNGFGEAVILNNIGLVYSALGQKQKALEYYEKALPIRKEVGDRAGEAGTLNNIGGVYSALGQNQKALEYFEKALPIQKEVGDRAGEATTLNNIGLVYSALGQNQKALEYYEKALLISQAVGDRAGEATTIYNIGNVYSVFGQNQKALEYYEKALSIQNDIGDRAGEAATINSIGNVYSDFGQKQKALEYYEKLLPIRKEVGDHAGEAQTLNNIGIVYSDLGQKQKALEFYQEALPIRKAVGDRAGEAQTLNNIGIVYSDLGQKQKALEYYEKALPIVKKVGYRAGEATTLNNIGLVYSDLGQKQKALEFYQEALPIRKEVGDRAGEANTLNNIGTMYFSLGQKQKALEYFEKALPIRKAVGDRTGEAITINNIGFIYEALGQMQKALVFYQQALPILEEVGDRTGAAMTLNNIGLVYSDLGQNQIALEYYEKSLKISQSVGDFVGEALTINNIGAVYDALCQNKKALDFYEKALPILQAVGDRAREEITFSNLMACWEALKNKQFSIFYGKQAVNAIQILRENISSLDRESKKSYLETTKDTYRFLSGLLIDEGRIPEAQHVLDMLKEKEYFEFTGKDRSTPPTYSQLDFTEFENQWLEKYKMVTKDYSALSGEYYLLTQKKIKSDEEKKQLKELEASLEQYRKDYDRYLAELKEAFDRYSKTVEKGTIETPNSQELLKERQVTLRKLDESEGGKNVFLHFLVQDERIAVIFTTPDSQFVRFSNVSKKQLNRFILEYREAIERRKSAPQKGVSILKEVDIDPANKTIYGKLYDNIFKPVDVELKKYGATNLMIYLDDILRYIALPVLWDGETYLVQRYRMTLFTSDSFARIQRAPGEINKILGLGASRGGKNFNPLPNVKEEIKGIVNDKEKGFNGLIPGKAFLDKDFTKETFVNQLKTASFPLVHISTHFAFNTGIETGNEGGDETQSHLLMGDGSLVNLKEIREKGNLFNHVELLMLSACETGRGDADGREIDGFGELAQQSGAQCVVASLWKVTDESTKDLMVNFYRILKEGKVTGKIEALRLAQLQLAGLDDLLDKNHPILKRERTKYSHPYYWGPFIMIGNWR